MTALPGKPAANATPDNGSGVDKLLAASPGARLQRAREAAQLTVKEAADALHLSPGVVKALEADDYRVLPNATFVKGYLRSYSRLLGIAGEELVRSYESITGSSKPQSVQPIETPRTAPRFATPLRFGVLGLVVVLVGVFLLWPDASEPEVSDVEEAVTAEQTTEEALSNVEVKDLPPVYQEASDLYVPPDLEREAVASPEPLPAETKEAVSDSLPEPAAAVEAPQAESVFAASSVSEAASVPEEAPVLSAPESPQGLVSMSFTGDCWVEIRDATGELIYSNLRRNGESLSIEGVPPLEAKLGNGNVVAVSYNGQPVSFRIPPHNVVRVRLGE